MNTTANDPQDREEITLSSSEFDQFKEDSSPTTVTRELSQNVSIKEHLKLFRIFDKKFINVNEKKSEKVISFFFKLAMLDPAPKRKRSLKFVPLVAGLSSVAIAWLIFDLKNSGLPILSSPYTYTGIVAFAVLGLILFVYVVKEFKNELVFYSQHGRAPIIELLYKVPNKREFQEFVAELIECINTEKSRNYYSESQFLAAELSEHRKLRDEGAISNKAYEAAKKHIMKYH